MGKAKDFIQEVKNEGKKTFKVSLIAELQIEAPDKDTAQEYGSKFLKAAYHPIMDLELPGFKNVKVDPDSYFFDVKVK